MHRGLDNLYAPVTQLQELTAARTLFVHTITMQLEQPFKSVALRSCDNVWECLSAPNITPMSCSSRHMHCHQSSKRLSEKAIDSVVLDPYHNSILRDEVETFVRRQFLL